MPLDIHLVAPTRAPLSSPVGKREGTLQAALAWLWSCPLPDARNICGQLAESTNWASPSQTLEKVSHLLRFRVVVVVVVMFAAVVAEVAVTVKVAVVVVVWSLSRSRSWSWSLSWSWSWSWLRVQVGKIAAAAELRR